MKRVAFVLTPPSINTQFSPTVATGLKGTSFIFNDLNGVRWQAKVVEAEFVSGDEIDLTFEVPDEAAFPKAAEHISIRR